MKQRRPFQVRITRADKEHAELCKSWYGAEYGFFFDTSGKCRMEQLNPRAQYTYIWTTNGKQLTPKAK